MMNTNLHLLVRFFLFPFALLTALDSIHAQTTKLTVALPDLASTAKCDDAILARRAVVALEQLKAVVVVQSSHDTFESHGRLAHVPFETFTHKLNHATAEVESTLSQMSDVKLRSHLSNSLYSYRDGAFWWARLDQERVIPIANLRGSFTTTTPAERFFKSTLPDRVVVHWRQANKYLQRAQKLINEGNTCVSKHSSSSLQNRKSDGSML
jgi:hypothetical protein